MPRPLSKVKNAQHEVRLKTILRDKRKKARFYLLVCGVVFIVAGVYLSNSPRSTSETVNTTTETNSEVKSFSQEPVSVDKLLLKEQKNTKKAPPQRVLIPSVGIDVAVKEAKVINGYWEVFSDSAGFGLGSAYSEDLGNQVIFAHAREGLFLPLKKVGIGEKVLVLTRDKWYSYEIKNIQEVMPSQTEVIAPTSETVLTLYTCTGFSDSKRLIVTAKRI